MNIFQDGIKPMWEDDKNKGGKAKVISTTFSEEKVKWENIIIQGQEKSDKKSFRFIEVFE